jgi:hypothetical protein
VPNPDGGSEGNSEGGLLLYTHIHCLELGKERRLNTC